MQREPNVEWCLQGVWWWSNEGQDTSPSSNQGLEIIEVYSFFWCLFSIKPRQNLRMERIRITFDRIVLRSAHSSYWLLLLLFSWHHWVSHGKQWEKNLGVSDSPDTFLSIKNVVFLAFWSWHWVVLFVCLSSAILLPILASKKHDPNVLCCLLPVGMITGLMFWGITRDTKDHN